MTAKTLSTYAFLLALLFVPVAARADAGTPLMWAGWFHLAILNIGIGVLEGALLAKLFRLPKLPTQTAMIPANYLSAFAGFLLLRWLWTPLEQKLPGAAPLFKAGPMLLGLLVASFLMSILLEWPFCAWALRGTARGWRASLGASAIAQTASYALLIPFYLLVSPISLLTGAHLERNLTFVRTPVATVFYIDPHDGGVWRIRTNGTGKAKVLDTHFRDEDMRLFVRFNPQTDVCDLYDVQLLPQSDGRSSLHETLLLPNVGTGFAPVSDTISGRGEPDNWFSFGRPADFRPKDKRDWTVRTGFWANGGISVGRAPSSYGGSPKTAYALAFETPFEDWTCRDATVLPSDQVVFQLGGAKHDGQIVILDMKRRKLGFLTMGQGPTVVMSPSVR